MNTDHNIWFLTWTTYGTWLRGDERGWTPRGLPAETAQPALPASDRERMNHPPLILDHSARAVVLAAIAEKARFRGRKLLAANVRSNHVHLLVEAPEQPDRMIADFKDRASRELRAKGLIAADRPVWTKGGCARPVPAGARIDTVIRYVAELQGANVDGAWFVAIDAAKAKIGSRELPLATVGSNLP